MTLSQLNDIAFYYWYTLRPEQLAPASGGDPVDPPVTDPTEPPATDPTDPVDPNAPADGGFDLIAVLKNFLDSITAWFDQLWNQIIGFFQQPFLK